MKALPVRKHPRRKGFDYNQNGMYFVTLCVKGKHEMLGEVVGRDDPGAPFVELSEYGVVLNKYINMIEAHYDNVKLVKYTIMPNHVHMILVAGNKEHGAPRSSRPTTSLIPRIIAALKKMTNKENEFDMWQTSYHDHIIRDEDEYQRIWKYIDENPEKWQEDCYFT